MTTTPGADELRMRRLLNGALGHTPAPPPSPPADTSDAWWNELYPDDDDEVPAKVRRVRIASPRLPNWRKGEVVDLDKADPDDPEADDEEEEAPPDWEEDTADPDDPAARTPGAVRNPGRLGARRAAAAYMDLPPRTRWLLVASAQAGAGWFLGLEPAMTGWIATCRHDTGSATTALILGAGMVATGAYAAHRTRLWWPPLAWACRIPLASALLALALYAPGVTP